jgi:hypothetical protein
MIVSHKYKFIFLKTFKTAGTSIEVFLSQHCGPEDIVTPIRPYVAPHKARNWRGYFNPLPEYRILGAGEYMATTRRLLKRKRFYNHMRGEVLRSRIPADIWDNYYKFTVERNPWDKIVSHYYDRAARNEGGLTFEEYLARGKFPLNYPIYTSGTEEPRLLVDTVVRYENLTEGLGEVFDRLGIPFSGSLGVRAKGGWRRDRRPCQDFYSTEQRDFVARVFATEIALHGYTFPGPD